MNKFKVGILGNLNERYEPHYTMNNCLASLHDNFDFTFGWIPTEGLREGVDAALDQYDGIIAGSGPYQSKEGVINGIRYARKNNIPFLGTCSGFGYSVLEFGQSVSGLATVYHPYEGVTLPENENFLQPLNFCGAGMHTIQFRLMRGTLVQQVYGDTETAYEESHCTYGVNRQMTGLFEKEGFIVSGYDEDGEPKVMEYTKNSFFVITLYLPQMRSAMQKPHPLLLAFLKAAEQRGQSIQIKKHQLFS